MQLRWPNLTLGVGVSAGFVLLLLLMTAITTVSLVRVAMVNRQVEQLVYQVNVKTDLVHKMKDSLRERAVTMHIISLLSDPFDQDEEYQRLGIMGSEFVAAREKLLALPLSEPEKDVLDRMRQLTVKNQPLVLEAVNKAMQQKNTEAQAMIRQVIAPSQREILALVNELLTLLQQQAQAAAALSQESYRNTRWLLGSMGVGAVLLGLAIAAVVVRNTNRQARQLQYQAMYDGLTGLPNRSLFADRLHQTMLISRRDKGSFAIMAVDLNRFKEINDTFGHHVGDAVLQQAARMIGLCLRESDTLARVGGDEFTILMPTAQTIDGAITVAKRILESLKQPVNVAGHELEISLSLGIAQFPLHSEKAEDLQRKADAAMYQAKRTQSGYRAYSAEFDQGAEDRLSLQTELRRAMSTDELVLHYQPKVDLDSRRVSGVEALVRWQHPRRGLIAPDQFIPLAEETGLIHPLTEVVLRKAVRQVAEWHRQGKRLGVAVNISAVNIQDPEFPALVKRILDEHELPADLLELELTESAVMSEPERAVENIKRLRELDVQISIDDFGTGYTSISQLKDLLVAKIKIDRTFIKDMTINHSDAVIVRTAVDLGHNLGLKVIAEGVENEETWNQLKILGCDSAQGYHMSRPLPPEAFLDWLGKSQWNR